MDAHGFILITSLALSLGFVHALDADHVIAVSGMISGDRSMKHGLSYALKWSAGHGLMLLAVAMLVLLFGVSLPESYSTWAERVVGVVVLAIGLYVLHDIRKQKLHVHFHKHDDGLIHAHWHQHQHCINSEHTRPHGHGHAPLLVGMVHGIAGSAPLLAMLPVLLKGNTGWGALLYVMIFSVAVALAMLLFGGVLSGMAKLLQQRLEKALLVFRVIAGLFAVGFGAHMVLL